MYKSVTVQRYNWISLSPATELKSFFADSRNFYLEMEVNIDYQSELICSMFQFLADTQYPEDTIKLIIYFVYINCYSSP
jgi:hypothetical protein